MADDRVSPADASPGPVAPPPARSPAGAPSRPATPEAGPRVDRAALERIIQRAAELQAAERDLGEGLTEAEVLALGKDVGIPGSHLRQALMEERTRAVVPVEHGLLARLAGPGHVSAERALAGDGKRVESALQTWMTEAELLGVKRRYPQQTTWEPRQGALASIKRALGFGGRAYVLTRAHEVHGQVIPLDAGRCHVRLIADLTNTRRERVGTATGLVGSATVVTVVALVLGVAAAVAILPIPLAAAVGIAIARSRRHETEKAQVALEQVLDHLERGETEGPHLLAGPRASAFGRIAEELRKNLGV